MQEQESWKKSASIKNWPIFGKIPYRRGGLGVETLLNNVLTSVACYRQKFKGSRHHNTESQLKHGSEANLTQMVISADITRRNTSARYGSQYTGTLGG